MVKMAVNRIYEVKRKYEATLLSIPGVISIGVSAEGIIVTVENAEVAKKIPKTIEGIPVIIRIGRVRLFQNTYTGRWRPIPGGVSIGAVTITAGTFSCMVQSRLTGEILGLSNCHVLGGECYGFGPPFFKGIGTPILQPGVYDGGQEPDDVVGQLLNWIPIKPYKPVSVDAAVFKPTSPMVLKRNIIDLGIIPVEPIEPKLGMHVCKVGRTTGLNYGTITAVDITAQVESEEYWLYDLFEVTPPPTQQYHIWFQVRDPYTGILVSPCEWRPAFGLPGDSGSLIVEEGGVRPVGLLFAGGYDETQRTFYTIGCKASNIERLLNVCFLYPTATPLTDLTGFLTSFGLTFGLTSVLTR